MTFFTYDEFALINKVVPSRLYPTAFVKVQEFFGLWYKSIACLKKDLVVFFKFTCNFVGEDFETIRKFVIHLLEFQFVLVVLFCRLMS